MICIFLKYLNTTIEKVGSTPYIQCIVPSIARIIIELVLTIDAKLSIYEYQYILSMKWIPASSSQEKQNILSFQKHFLWHLQDANNNTFTGDSFHYTILLQCILIPITPILNLLDITSDINSHYWCCKYNG